MNFWAWLTTNSGALQSIAAVVGALLSAVTIFVLVVTWRAIKAQANAANALTAVAIEQTEALKRQAEAALKSVSATDAANCISEEANKLLVDQMRTDLRPILIFGSAFQQGEDITRDAIRNVGRGPAKDVQISMGTAKDDLPKNFIPSRTLIGSGDEVIISIVVPVFEKAGMTIHYASLDGRRFATTIYKQDNSIKHEFEELNP